MSNADAVPFDDTKQDTVDAAGNLTIEIRPSQSFMTWIIYQVTTEMPDAPIGATSAIRKRGALITPMLPTGDVGGGDPPVTLRAGESLTVEWEGATPGDVATVWYSYGQIDPRQL